MFCSLWLLESHDIYIYIYVFKHNWSLTLFLGGRMVVCFFSAFPDGSSAGSKKTQNSTRGDATSG